jgi:hypothetical protein
MRAKMKITSINRTEHGEELTMNPVSRSGAYPINGADEDNTYARFTPTGELKLMLTNPELFGKFNPGETYHLDFTKLES